MKNELIPDRKEYKDGEPCEHRGCLNHVTHPCEGCGRIAGRNRPTDQKGAGADQSVLDDSSSESVKIDLSGSSGTEIFFLMDFGRRDTTKLDMHICKYCNCTAFYVKRSNGEMTCQKCNEKHDKIMSLNFI